jgi:hypothetical protein
MFRFKGPSRDLKKHQPRNMWLKCRLQESCRPNTLFTIPRKWNNINGGNSTWRVWTIQHFDMVSNHEKSCISEQNCSELSGNREPTPPATRLIRQPDLHGASAKIPYNALVQSAGHSGSRAWAWGSLLIHNWFWPKMFRIVQKYRFGTISPKIYRYIPQKHVIEMPTSGKLSPECALHNPAKMKQY